MKQVAGYAYLAFHYDSQEEREEHIKKMEQEGFSAGSKVKEFTGKLSIDDTSDPKNYVPYADFTKAVIY